MSTNLKMIPQWLKIIAEGNQTGCFQITDSRDNTIIWNLYINGKNLHYATSNIGKKERLSYLLKKVSHPQSLPNLEFKDNEYKELLSWGNSQGLSEQKIQQLLFNLSQEALGQILLIKDPSVELLSNNKIEDPIGNFSLESLVETAQKSSQKWQQLSVNFVTPFSRLYLDSEKTYDFYQFWKKQEQSNSRRISFWLLNLAKKKCLYELAEERQVTPLRIAYYFRSLLTKKIIEILPFETEEISKKTRKVDSSTFLKQDAKSTNLTSQPVVACIDDSHTVQQQIKRILEAVGYQVLSITDPTSSLVILARNPPKLILMDVKMPEIDGHELCKMLQRSQRLRNIPIVMLTAEEGMVSRLQAKMSGANYYLKKPCDVNTLIDVVQRFAPRKN